MMRVKIKKLEWDQYNIAHIARHNVVPSEVEEVCKAEVTRLKSKSHPTRIVLIGKTQTQRKLKIVFEPKENEVWRPITAHDASKKERNMYIKGVGGEQTV